MNKLQDLISRKTIRWRKTCHCWAVQRGSGQHSLCLGAGDVPDPAGRRPGPTVPVPLGSGNEAFCARLPASPQQELLSWSWLHWTPKRIAVSRLLRSLHVLWKQAAESTPEAPSLERSTCPQLQEKVYSGVHGLPDKSHKSWSSSAGALALWFCKDTCLFSLGICLGLIIIYSV